MSLITVENLSLSYGRQNLFDGVGFSISAEDRIGLVGRNGMGKTSLFRCVVGELQPDGGEIRHAKGIRVGYLPQEVKAGTGVELLTSVLDAVPGRSQVEQDLQRVESELASCEDEEAQQDLLVRFGDLRGRLDHYEANYAKHEAERILTGLGFLSSQFRQPLNELSGGWRMRAALASILFQQPDLLLLDEPTNHLDLPSVQWFDGFLRKYPGAFLLVSHDRGFLNRQISRVISLEVEGLRSYPGHYDNYVQLRQEEDALLQNRAKNLEREKREIERFVERFKAKATKARAASSKAKVLRKMDKVQTLDLPKDLHFRFPETDSSGRQVVHVKGVSKSFGDHTLYRDLDLRIYRGERVALVGANGTGKTTLLRIVAEDLDASTGEILFGHQVTTGYYAQHCADNLHPALTVMQTLWNDVPAKSQTEVRNVLGTFLFSGDDALKPVKVLSGGERARVALARLVVSPTNLMLMDEPTNHLDLNASEALAEALENYSGSLLFVSHNLSLLKRIATKVWDMRDGTVHEYIGGFEHYLRSREKEVSGISTEGHSDVGDSAARSKAAQKEKRRIEAQQRQMLTQRLGKLPQKIAEMEKRIAALEERQASLEAELAKQETYEDQERYQALLREFTAGNSKLEQLMARWEGMEEQREGICSAVAECSSDEEQ